ncbi:MAG: MerR family transcriptional regulator [Propionibacteriaceae bacterium]|jgi:DNA-binding transcriptional MerR regulator|nr:MerR family transcriptional regulator [Propionibacteriaceae bacterium]
MGALGLRSIGQVLSELKPDYPDLSISKIRFLETEGLISPERAESGYRRFSESDIERLRFILEAQKRHYMPLKIIREQLDAMDRGESPGGDDGDGGPKPIDIGPKPVPPRRSIRMTRRELLQASGLPEQALSDLERAGLVAPRRGTVYYGRDQLTVAVVCRRLAAYGMDARHLRIVKQSAEREVGLIEQAILPYLKRNPQTARQAPGEVMQLILYAHAAIMRQNLQQ